ncbi:hypothetical protein GCM10008090_20930 [Arenicella chitinivorans]|uniref:Uncharacterized protein n=1 Tax=Arenicella chitinivorans TaxID=1329800 RepID=A0A918RTX8_9GAMM|nr:hypothetical protein [Arenicella chitinivorans]GHA10990.1 hypothetical protein GCM10008090_20930 [Arenicella chitinivorans]
MEKLLVAILGNRNSGKSHTWNTLFGATVRTGKEERRLYFNNYEYVNVFLVSGSPEERQKYVGDLIADTDPRIVLCSTQYKDDVKTTYEYFLEKSYFIFVHWLNPGYWDGDDSLFDSLGLTNWLLSKNSMVGIRSGKISASSRVNEMKEFIYGWAKARNLIINEQG